MIYISRSTKIQPLSNMDVYTYIIELFDNISREGRMAILAVKEEIILSALLMLGRQFLWCSFEKKSH